MGEIEKLFNYLYFNDENINCDVMIGCGSADTFIPLVCSKLYRNGNYKKILFTGYKGKGTIGKIKESEADIFKNIAIKNDVDANDILIENKSMSTYSNMKYSFKILKYIDYNNVMIVHKPYVNRRLSLIIKKYKNTYIHNFSMSFDEYVMKSSMNKEQIINEMVGEIYLLKNVHRIKIDNDILKIYYGLIAAGYKRYVYLFDRLIYKLYI